MIYIQPVFKEYVQFLKDNGCDVSWFRENTFWLDRNTIKAFDSGGGILSLYRVFIDDDLNVLLTKHKSYKEGLSYETWDETVHRELPRLKELEAHSIDIIRENCLNPDRRIVSTNSTGKDSMVVMRLAEKSGIEFETCFNVTTLDVAESNRMAKRNGFDFITPPERYKGFYDYIKRYDYGGYK